ncbi:MAG TPA: aminodeoxychorismate/anthranilate synthase component II [Blastocatellia bacterium]|nr:aminodeoxychorismate/anthranilate synthase component II [Blastocatellia bacterium]
MTVLVIDNYDSFTYNLVQYLGELGADIEVYRNDQITMGEIESKAPRGLVLSPGPKTPAEAGITMETIRTFSSKIPILGVCLGHQAMGEVFGGRVVRASQIMHGKTSKVLHDGRGVFRGLDNPFDATRYHSLVVERTSIPDCLEVSATSGDGIVMGMRHKQYPCEGVQFHPESILTGQGKKMLENFLNSLDVH